MSRIGQMPVALPDGVEVTIAGQLVTAKGKLGELSVELTPEVEISREESELVVRPRAGSNRAQALWGTSRSLLSNIVVGVSEGFTVNLEIQGVGYRAAVQGKELVLQLGFSHEIHYPIPEGVTVTCPQQTEVSIFGANRQQIGQIASEIRSYRPPEPYKGKGVRYQGEYVMRKEGKKK